jgi:hypothetical protein
MKTALLCAALLAAASPVHARDLQAEIAAADARLFGALNARDLETMKTGFSPRLEFYHDRSGVTNYADNIRIFGQKFQEPGRIRREAMPDTWHIYPAGPDAAMQIGSHRFCFRPAPEAPEECSVYGFSTVWAREDGQWKMLRVMSYGH